jgi:hypothetical protein
MNSVPWKTLHDVRDKVIYMHELSASIYREKKHALEQGDEAVARQIGRGKDILSVLSKWTGLLISGLDLNKLNQ